MEQVRGLAALVLLTVIIVFTYRSIKYCWEAFRDDKAGLWITISEVLAGIAWSLIAVDALLAFVATSIHIIGLVFWLAFSIKAISTVIKAEMGYRVVRDTYRELR